MDNAIYEDAISFDDIMLDYPEVEMCGFEAQALALHDINLEMIVPEVLKESISGVAYDLAMEDFNNSSNSLWEKIKDKIAIFIDKVKSFWDNCISFMKEEVVRKQNRWYSDKQFSININLKTVLEDKPMDLTVKVRQYKIKSPGKEISKDIVIASDLLSAIYKKSYDIMELLIANKNSNDASVNTLIDDLSKEINELYSAFASKCGITTTPDLKLRRETIKEAILGKYFVKGEKDDVPVVDLIQSEEDISFVFDDTLSNNLITLCNVIKKRDVVCGNQLAAANNALRYSNEVNTEVKNKYISSLKSGALYTMITVQQFTNLIGNLYFQLFVDIRGDIKKCANAILEYKHDYTKDYSIGS